MKVKHSPTPTQININPPPKNLFHSIHSSQNNTPVFQQKLLGVTKDQKKQSVQKKKKIIRTILKFQLIFELEGYPHSILELP